MMQLAIYQMMIPIIKIAITFFYSQHCSCHCIADVMKNMGAQTIIAIDVGSEYHGELMNYGDHLSGWWLLWNRWNPFSENVRVSISLCRQFCKFFWENIPLKNKIAEISLSQMYGAKMHHILTLLLITPLCLLRSLI